MSKRPARFLPEEFPSSPQWLSGTKLFVAACLLAFFVAIAYRFNALVLYLIVSVVFSYVIRPIVDTIDNYIRVPRWIITLAIYLTIFGTLVSIPVSFLLPFTNSFLGYVGDFPTLISESGLLLIARLREPFVLFGRELFIPIDNIVLEDLQQYLGDAVSLLGSSIGSFSDVVTSIATSSISFLTWLIFVLFVSFYITNLEHGLGNAFIRLVPSAYVEDARYLTHQLDTIWGAFLRGQVILMLAMGVLTFIVASILGLPNAAGLGIIAGLLEVVPYAGPLLAGVPALVIAFFQSDASWLGILVTPLLFTFIVAVAYWLLQQIENYILLPRIMGGQLHLHPVFVFMGVIAGWQIAGIFGIFLASPMIATIRLVLKYLYCKVTDQTELELSHSAELATMQPPAQETVPETEPTEGELSAETTPSPQITTD